MKKFLIYQLSHFSLANIWLPKEDSFFRFILLLLGNINVNASQTTVSQSKIPLNNLPIYNSDEPIMPSACYSSDYIKGHVNFQMEYFLKNRLAYFTFKYEQPTT